MANSYEQVRKATWTRSAINPRNQQKINHHYRTSNFKELTNSSCKSSHYIWQEGEQTEHIPHLALHACPCTCYRCWLLVCPYHHKKCKCVESVCLMQSSLWLSLLNVCISSWVYVLQSFGIESLGRCWKGEQCACFWGLPQHLTTEGNLALLFQTSEGAMWMYRSTCPMGYLGVWIVTCFTKEALKT